MEEEVKTSPKVRIGGMDFGVYVPVACMYRDISAVTLCFDFAGFLNSALEIWSTWEATKGMAFNPKTKTWDRTALAAILVNAETAVKKMLVGAGEIGDLMAAILHHPENDDVIKEILKGSVRPGHDGVCDFIGRHATHIEIINFMGAIFGKPDLMEILGGFMKDVKAGAGEPAAVESVGANQDSPPDLGVSPVEHPSTDAAAAGSPVSAGAA